MTSYRFADVAIVPSPFTDQSAARKRSAVVGYPAHRITSRGLTWYLQVRNLNDGFQSFNTLGLDEHPQGG